MKQHSIQEGCYVVSYNLVFSCDSKSVYHWYQARVHSIIQPLPYSVFRLEIQTDGDYNV